MTLYCIRLQTFVVTCANISTFSLFGNVLPEAFCCLQTCYVDIMLLLMVCWLSSYIHK